MVSAPRARRAWVRWLAVVGVVLLAAEVVVTAVFFVAPSTGALRRASAVVVLGGYGNRIIRGLQVARAEHVSTLVVSVGGSRQCPRLAKPRVICFRPDPFSTQGEARAIGRLARLHGWRRLDVVAGTTQVSRARLRIGRCYDGVLGMVGVDPTGLFGWVHFVAYDEAAMVKALVWQWSC